MKLSGALRHIYRWTFTGRHNAVSQVTWNLQQNHWQSLK